jgi:hypothetical protein
MQCRCITRRDPEHTPPNALWLLAGRGERVRGPHLRRAISPPWPPSTLLRHYGRLLARPLVNVGLLAASARLVTTRSGLLRPSLRAKRADCGTVRNARQLARY